MPLYDARPVLVPLRRVNAASGTQAFMSCTVLQGRIRHDTETDAWIEVVIELVINGETRTFPAALTLSQLIDVLGLTGKRIAIEKNGEIVPRSQHAGMPLANGDCLEIVVAVGGG
jgi:sulfur carrier protein